MTIKLNNNAYNQNYIQKNEIANVDADNFSQTGRERLTSFGFPSTTNKDLTLLASGEVYTAPADGWFLLTIEANNDNEFIVSTNLNTCWRDNPWGLREGHVTSICPARKGEKVSIVYTVTGQILAFKFIYAVGSQ